MAWRANRPRSTPERIQAMLKRNVEETPPEARQMEIFLALVEAQDQGVGVARSRKLVADRFGVTESQVKQIEEEGIDRQWPPLN
jgi:hypothetical protein